MCLPGDEITDVQVRPGDHYYQWMSGIVTTQTPDGPRNELQLWAVDGGQIHVMLSDPMPAAGRGLSGGVHAWRQDGEQIVVVTKTDGIVLIEMNGCDADLVTPLPFDRKRSWSTPCIDQLNGTVYAIADWKELWSCKIRTKKMTLEYDGSTFLMDAIAGIGGMCVAWDAPHMPWTESTVFPETVQEGVAVQQPRFSTNGFCFGYIGDVHGVNNLHILGDEIIAGDVVLLDDCEHGGPTWGPGQRTWCFNTDGTRVAYTRNEGGFSSLWVYDRATASRHRIGQGVHGCVSWENNTIAAIRTGARTPPQVVTYNVTNLLQPERTITRTVADPRWKHDEFNDELVEPTVHRAPGAEVSVPYRLYRPHSPNGLLIVWVHGGPNDQWQVTFRPRFTYWLSRGYTIAVVDHRGTTGHGRQFLMALEGHWGDMDATDTLQVIRHVQTTQGFLPESTVLMGGSAGGLTALNCIVKDAPLVAGAVLQYPVVDLAEILRGDDPFETPYMPTLIGATGPDDPVVTQRSPHMHGSAFTNTPLLVFHGDSDHSVPLVHSLRLHEAVVAAGGQMQLEVMAGEGHGFKNPANVTAEYRITEEFLNRLFTA